jgi:DNA-directed RNA polymerase subunit RPC12/RpoP
MTQKRLKFQCWNCPETYSLLRSTEGVRIILVACPYCGAEAEVDLKPYERRVVSTHKGDKIGEQTSLQLPDVLPTRPRTQKK